MRRHKHFRLMGSHFLLADLNII